MITAILCLLVVVAVLVTVRTIPPAQIYRPPKGYIPYDQAVQLLCSGQVKTLGQAHSRMVVLDLKNGTTLYTVEPQIDMIWRECQNCGNACKGTTYWTE